MIVKVIANNTFLVTCDCNIISFDKKLLVVVKYNFTDKVTENSIN